MTLIISQALALKNIPTLTELEVSQLHYLAPSEPGLTPVVLLLPPPDHAPCPLPHHDDGHGAALGEESGREAERGRPAG